MAITRRAMFFRKYRRWDVAKSARKWTVRNGRKTLRVAVVFALLSAGAIGEGTEV